MQLRFLRCRYILKKTREKFQWNQEGELSKARHIYGIEFCWYIIIVKVDGFGHV